MAEPEKTLSAQQALPAEQAGVEKTKVEVVKLKRDLGVLGSFSIGFADVGADIYVALGLVLFFAMGAAPLALAVGLPGMSPTTIGTTYQNDPVTGVAKGISIGLGRTNPLVILLPLWVGLLGVFMLLMSTNTGVIGASRVTHSMARFKIMPSWFSKVHP